MLRILLVILLFPLGTSLFGQSKVGAHIGYGTGFNEMKFGINGEQFLTHKFSLASSLSFYTTQEKRYVTTHFWEFSFDGHLYLIRRVASNVYGIFGIDYVHSKATDGTGEYKEGSAWFNVGAGASFGTGKLHPFFECKFVGSSGELQAILAAGVRFDINKYETD